MGLSAGTFVIIDQLFALIEIGFKAQELKDKFDAMKAAGKTEDEVAAELDKMLDDEIAKTQAIIDADDGVE